jgi:hypothetical protein
LVIATTSAARLLVYPFYLAGHPNSTNYR